MKVSPSLTQVDLSRTPESPDPCLKEGELEPRQLFCPDSDQGTSGSSNFTQSGSLWGGGDRFLGRIGPLGKPMSSSEEFLCHWVWFGDYGSPSDWGLAEDRDYPSKRFSFLISPNALEGPQPWEELSHQGIFPRAGNRAGYKKGALGQTNLTQSRISLGVCLTFRSSAHHRTHLERGSPHSCPQFMTWAKGILSSLILSIQDP